MYQVIQLHQRVPRKPAPGQPCNGCGVCCATAPCPIGMAVSRRTRGACLALEWREAESRYRCGLISNPAAWLPRGMQWAAALAASLARRYVSAGSGCDSLVEAVAAHRHAA